MQATSPKDELQYFGEHVELPAPKYSVGTRINVDKLSDENKKYLWSVFVRHELRSTRTIINKLQRQGYMSSMTGKKMLPFNKKLVREKLDMVRFADTVELASAQPFGMHVSTSVGNQCYLRNGQSHSGVGYSYFLLFRRSVEGQKLAFLPSLALLREENVKGLLPVPPQAKD